MGSAGVNGRRPRVRWQTIAQVLLWSAIGLGAFVLLAESMQNSAAFDRLRLWILLVDACGVIAPLLIVYLSSLEFINRGIDSWFRVEVKEALNDALGLSRAALELRMREHSARTVALAEGLSGAPPAEMQARLDAERRASQAIEIALFGAHGQILAASLESPLESLPSEPSPDLVRQVGERRPYVSLEPRSGGRYLIRAAAALGDPGAGHDARFVVAIYPVPPQLGALTDAVQNA